VVDVAVPVLAGAVLGDDAGATDVLDEVSDDGDSADVLEESVDDELVGSASATPGLVVIATPSPSATAKAPTRPTYLAYPIVAPRWDGGVRRHGTLRRPKIRDGRIDGTPHRP
jgi:hypothetical protein